MDTFAQQDPMFTQYMFNTLTINPAYAGSKEAISFVGLYRKQWVGVDGAPTTQTITVHGPISKQKTGLGISLMNDAIGSIKQIQTFVDLSHRIQVTDESYLRLGLKAGGSTFSANYADLIARDLDDELIHNFSGEFLPNIGAGLFYYSDNYYLGFSIPKFLKNYVKGPQNSEILQEETHYFLNGGYVFDINKAQNMTIKPSFMLRHVNGAPMSVDLNTTVYLSKQIGIGAGIRLNDSVSGLLQYFFKSGLYFGYSYDHSISKLNHFNTGSHEIMIGYDLSIKARKNNYPRCF